MSWKCDDSMYGVPLKNKCRNNDVRGRHGLKEDVVTRVEKGTTGWFDDHLERKNESDGQNQSIKRKYVIERAVSESRTDRDTLGSRKLILQLTSRRHFTEDVRRGVRRCPRPPPLILTRDNCTSAGRTLKVSIAPLTGHTPSVHNKKF
ncbi:hypothetical protein EVAR_35267_1 [Eumeta japonica]|uniref:Uncharacterized protein n=1 Tax=Eumeta variegata TaxID=151549 RepID=A0A4C1VCV3_EUMVA|nr:hypothetical protein EVAR_35267_1 [Eumeta japonica]